MYTNCDRGRLRDEGKNTAEIEAALVEMKANRDAKSQAEEVVKTGTPTNEHLTAAGFEPVDFRPVPYDWQYLGRGQTRMGFYHRGYVIKVPRDDQGLAENENEAALYKQQKEEAWGPMLAPCRLMPNGWLVMKWVRPVSAIPGHHSPPVYSKQYTGSTWRSMSRARRSHPNAPDWFWSFDDGAQGGCDQNGNYRLYDYARVGRSYMRTLDHNRLNELAAEASKRRKAGLGLAFAVKAWATAELGRQVVSVPDPPASGVRVRARYRRRRFTSPLALVA
jgi:hypothetical protein